MVVIGVQRAKAWVVIVRRRRYLESSILYGKSDPEGSFGPWRYNGPHGSNNQKTRGINARLK